MKTGIYSLVVLLAVGLGLGLTGCSSSSEKTEKEVTVVTVDPDLPMMTSKEMASHFTNDQYVVLRGIMLSGIDRLIDWGDRFLVLDRRGQQVTVFDATGNCIWQIKRQGKGPGEYIQLTDCTIDNTNDELILYADMPGKLLWFDRDGNYLREERISDCLTEVLCAGDDLYGINCGKGRTLPEYTIARMQLEPKGRATEMFLPYDVKMLGASAGSQLSSNGAEVWLSRPFDYTVYRLDSATREFVPRYRFDFGKHNLPDGYAEKITELAQVRKDGYIFHVPKVGVAGNYLFFTGFGTNYYMMDTVSKKMMKLGRTPVCGSSEYAMGGYGLLENQNKRIVHQISTVALTMWYESMKNEKAGENEKLKALVVANEEFMNPVLLFQDVL